MVETKRYILWGNFFIYNEVCLNLSYSSHIVGLDLELYKMNVTTVLLNGKLEEEIYTEQLIGFVEKDHDRKVSNLRCSIYDLKRSSRQWYIRLREPITSYEFTMISENHCVYVKSTRQSFLILFIYGNDILLAGNDVEFQITVEKWLSSQRKMNYMGYATYVLGVKIRRDWSRKLLTLSQESYIFTILEMCKMILSNPTETLVTKGNVNLKIYLRPKKNEMKGVSYSSDTGSLMYVMKCLWSNVCYHSSPRKKYWITVKRILRYLRGTMDYFLWYQGSGLHLTWYTDADRIAIWISVYQLKNMPSCLIMVWLLRKARSNIVQLHYNEGSVYCISSINLWDCMADVCPMTNCDSQTCISCV